MFVVSVRINHCRGVFLGLTRRRSVKIVKPARGYDYSVFGEGETEETDGYLGSVRRDTA